MAKKKKRRQMKTSPVRLILPACILVLAAVLVGMYLTPDTGISRVISGKSKR